MADNEAIELLREIRDILAANAVKREQDLATHEEQGQRMRAEFLDVKREEYQHRNRIFLALVIVIAVVALSLVVLLR
jgi:hypothetical protein